LPIQLIFALIFHHIPLRHILHPSRRKVANCYFSHLRWCLKARFDEFFFSFLFGFVNEKMDGLFAIGKERAGKYSPGYERVKVKKVGAGDLYPINMQLKGDLLREFTVGLNNGQYVLKFQTELAAIKVAAAEKNYKTDIYRPSNDQLEDAKEVLIEGVKNVLKELF
jgi:hypothetical protein